MSDAAGAPQSPLPGAAAIRGALGRTALALALSGVLASPAAPADGPPAPPRILVTNDDGVSAPGLAALAAALEPLGDVVVVAPRENQSGIGHALSLAGPLYVDEVRFGEGTALAVSATPASCVRAALDAPLVERPALVVSGINAGLNWGRNAYISGTVAAAREAVLHGVPALAVSVASDAPLAFGPAAEWSRRLAAAALGTGLPEGVLLNVSVPRGTPSVARLTRQSAAYGTESFEERRTPYGRRLLWGRFRQPTGGEPGTDVWTVMHGEVAITPLRLGEDRAGADVDLAAFAREAGLAAP